MLAVMSLKDFLVDPESDAHLSAMPQEEAVSTIKKSLGFLSLDMEVTMRDGMVTIALPDEAVERAEEAQKWYRHGDQSGEQGDYIIRIVRFDSTNPRFSSLW